MSKLEELRRLSELVAIELAALEFDSEVDMPGLFKGDGIPKGKRVNTFYECGVCGAYHRTDFRGDCREDDERWYELPDDAIIVEELKYTSPRSDTGE